LAVRKGFELEPTYAYWDPWYIMDLRAKGRALERVHNARLFRYPRGLAALKREEK